MSFNFKDLDLSDVSADGGPVSNYIDVGKHNVKIIDAAVEQCANPKHYRVRVNFADEKGRSIRNDFNVVNKSAQAVEIGKAQLKSLLEQAKHPNPDNPEDISTLKGLSVMIDVKMGKPREIGGPSYPEIKSYEAASKPVGTKVEDEIPF